MTLIEALRNAASIAVIVQLLGSYLETVEAYDRGRVLTETLTVRPVRGERDLERRYHDARHLLRRQLVADHADHLVLAAELVDVFGTAWERVRELEHSLERAA